MDALAMIGDEKTWIACDKLRGAGNKLDPRFLNGEPTAKRYRMMNT